MKTSITFLLLAFLVSTSPCFADVPMNGSGVVTNVVDGNHILCQSSGHQFKLRLAGIVPPRLSETNGLSAKAALADMVLGSNILFQANSRLFDGDHYVAWVSSTNRKTNINLKMIQLGWAKAEKTKLFYPPFLKVGMQGKIEDALTTAEHEAREQKVGIWRSTESPKTSVAAGASTLQQQPGRRLVIGRMTMNLGSTGMASRVAGGLLVLLGVGVLVLARKKRSFVWLLVGIALAGAGIGFLATLAH